jgi:hypothetical protein
MVRRRFALWFLAVAGPAAWVAHLLVSYALVPFACGRDASVTLHVTTIVAGVLALAATVSATRALARRSPPGRARSLDAAAGRVGPAAGTGEAVVVAVGLLLGAFFLLVVAVAGLAPAIVGPCT